MAEPRKVSFGFLQGPFQALDIIGPMDILHNVSTNYVKVYAEQVSEDANALVSKSLDIEFHHIGGKMEPQLLTGNFHGTPTCTYDTCPKLDYLLVGGPDPKFAAEQMPEPMKEFLHQKSKECKTIFATCTGAFVLAGAGILDGQHATVNHAFVGFGEKNFPRVKWSKDKNWVVSDDGRFWTASGAVSGTDMMAEWVKQQTSDGLLDLCTMLLEYQPRNVDGKPVSFVNGRGEQVKL